MYSKVVKASDINTASTEDIKVINGDQEICTLSAGGSLKMELFIRNGVGFCGYLSHDGAVKQAFSRGGKL